MLENKYDIVLDLAENQLFLKINLEDINKIYKNPKFKVRINRYVDNIDEKEKKIYFRKSKTYIEFIKIKEELEKLGKKLLITEKLEKYIKEKNIYIEKRYELGKKLKNLDFEFKNEFKKFEEVIQYGMTRKLREKQLRDVFFMLLMKKVSNFSVPGSGKTTSVLAVYTYLKEKNGINKIIVVGPKNSFGTWIDEYNKCFENIDEARVFNVHEKNGKNNRIKKMELEYETGNKNLFLFNYESLSNYTKEIKKKLDQKTLLVFDEIHKIKKIDGQWAKKALEISENSNYIIALTGTPIPNSYLDIYNLLHILYNQEYNDFFAFTPKMLKRPNEEIINNINKRINPFFCRTTKKELGVPEVEEDIIYHVDATKNENRILKILINKYNKNKLILYLRILQLESAPQMLLESLDVNKFREILEITEDIEDIDYKDYSKEIVKLINSINITSKMKECVRKSEEIYKEGKNLIIWCIFKETMYKLNNLFQEKGIKVKIINGEVELEERENIIKNFKNKNFNILITNPHTLAESVSLHTVCHDALYFEYSYNLVHLLQSKDRIHRLGLLENQKTQYYYMQTYYDGKKFSMDKKIYERLKEKEKIMLDAIEKNILEKSTTSKEDLDIIFREFF